MSNMIFRHLIEVESHVVKKNGRDVFFNKKTGRMFPGKSAKLVKAENHLVKAFRHAWWMTFNEDKSPINYPVIMCAIFHFNEKTYYTKKGNINKKLPDLDNLYGLVQDCLQKAGVIENDFYIDGHDGSRRKPTPDQNYLEIMLFKA